MQTTRTGPRCVIFFFLIFYILINVLFYVFRFYSTKYAKREMGHADDENGPNQRIQRHLVSVCENDK